MAQGKRSPLHARIGDRLRRARRERDLSQRRLGELAGLSFTAIQNIEEGRAVPGADTIEKLASALSVDPCWLAYGRGELPDWLHDPSPDDST